VQDLKQRQRRKKMYVKILKSVLQNRPKVWYAIQVGSILKVAKKGENYRLPKDTTYIIFPSDCRVVHPYARSKPREAGPCRNTKCKLYFIGDGTNCRKFFSFQLKDCQKYKPGRKKS
jgi:hypothetical protein